MFVWSALYGTYWYRRPGTLPPVSPLISTSVKKKKKNYCIMQLLHNQLETKRKNTMLVMLDPN